MSIERDALVSDRAEAYYRVRFVKTASARAPDDNRGSTIYAGEHRTLLWRPSQHPEGDGCYRHYDPPLVLSTDRRLELIREHHDANRHPGTWWTSYDIDGALIFSDCQVEVIEGPVQR